LLLAQLAIAHRRIDVAQVRGEPASREFRAINPIGKVPAIRFEDGRVLSESGRHPLHARARHSPVSR